MLKQEQNTTFANQSGKYLKQRIDEEATRKQVFFNGNINWYYLTGIFGQYVQKSIGNSVPRIYSQKLKKGASLKMFSLFLHKSEKLEIIQMPQNERE